MTLINSSWASAGGCVRDSWPARIEQTLPQLVWTLCVDAIEILRYGTINWCAKNCKIGRMSRYAQRDAWLGVVVATWEGREPNDDMDKPFYCSRDDSQSPIVAIEAMTKLSTYNAMFIEWLGRFSWGLAPHLTSPHLIRICKTWIVLQVRQDK